MKHIISTTGKPISFKLTLNKVIVIDTKIPVQVEQQDFDILVSRLGFQIKDVTPAPKAPVAPSAPTTTTQSPVIPSAPSTPVAPTAPETSLNSGSTTTV